jgi:hypothetical protein
MKTTASLGRMVRVELRDVFTTEASDFTPWLAQEENLSLLSETIGLELECEAQEKDVGPYRADILCKDAGSGNWVLIENQIERTDHIHLGQLLTYAAGLEAVSIVWIAERFTAEHRAALDWLNEHTDEHINFFGLEIELWRIGESPVAPKFNVVSQPNDWRRTVRAAAESGNVTEVKQIQLRFWVRFNEFLGRNSEVRCQKPSPQHWMSHSIGSSEAHLNSILSTWNSLTHRYGPEIRVELALKGPAAKQNFAALEKRRAQIEKALGESVVWHNPDDKKQCKIYVRQDADFTNEQLWPEQQQWLKQKLELFKKVFAPILRELPSAKALVASAGG